MISYRNVSKKYNGLEAVSDFSLEIENGEFFGLLGPNGAGKTTLIRMTTTLTPITQGEIYVDGEPIDRDLTAIKQKFGIVPQYSTLENDLTAWENLELHGRFYGIAKNTRRERIEELLEFTELTDRRNDTAGTFSGGMQRKLMIAKSLMHGPQIMLLDEPTVGLDAASRRKIWDLMRRMNEDGLTIFLTTHYLDEAEALCSRVGMIDLGKLVMLGNPSEIISQTGKFALEYFKEGTTHQELFEEKEPAMEAAKLLQCDFKIRETNLEDAFILITNKGFGA
ncbi:MAG: ABC transporter ATP-binding protein [Oscillospiraceae bacterium]|nr:ABC transporter ATP-binding protein [Oscillospiraceae bacterium]